MSSEAGTSSATANAYTNGTAEQMVGEFAASRREELVIATKYSMSTRPGDPNAGGNSRKSMIRSVEASLTRLRIDYIDLLYLHMWDGATPVEEVLRGMDDLVRAGKVLYVGVSDIPAWQVSRMQAIADLRGWAPLVALQIPYNLVERTVERDLIPMAETMELGGRSMVATGERGPHRSGPGHGRGLERHRGRGRHHALPSRPRVDTAQPRHRDAARRRQNPRSTRRQPGRAPA
jgi:aryl-alcohol dehydrogenase-like predicted oxidoreductase